MIGGRYRPIKLLGQGGMGSVYLVEHIRTGERMALKLMTGRAEGKAAERFQREARATANIKSEHVVRVLDADVAPEIPGAPPYLVMELLDGVDLAEATGDAPQPPALVVAWLAQVARGLDKAHAIRVVHRDLKPENLFLTRRDDGSALVKILDFGLAKAADELESYTLTGQVFGSPMFMAPEQARGDKNAVAPAIDVWALGMIAYKLLTGQHYWKANVVTHVLARIVYERPKPPSAQGCALGPAFDAWFLRSCEPDAKKRWTSAGEQIEALASALGISAQARAAALFERPVQGGATESGSLEDAKTLQASSSDARSRVNAGSKAARALGYGAVALLGAAGLALGVLGIRSRSAPASLDAPSASAPAPPPASASAPPLPPAASASAPAAASSPAAASAPAPHAAPPKARPSKPPRSVLDEQY